MFDIELMKFNPETPSFLAMLITALFAFVLCSIIAVTYEFTTKSIYRKAHFLQSLALIGIVAATILQAIGESVAIGLGIIGALSIIRFRTALNDPRNITFMFASLGAGIACGVTGFGIALTGTTVFCLGAIVMRFSPLSNANELIGTLKLRVPKEERLQKIIEQKLKVFCRDFELDRIRFFNAKKSMPVAAEVVLAAATAGVEVPLPAKEEVDRENLQEFIYLIRLKNNTSITALEETMRNIEGLKNFGLDFQKQPTKL
ncbi:MAG: DUF4956 domain-containing protein [Bacteroidota bacterium]